jgi:thiol-disulfide isomerase/thioredoxin
MRVLALVVVLGLIGTDAAARASDLEVRTLDGETVPLSVYFEPGKWTMVMMWTTYCGICRSQYPAVSAFHDKHKDTDAKVVGISLDGYAEVAKVRDYITSKPMTFISAIAEVDAIRAAYKALTEDAFTGTPTYLMFDPDGALVATVPGTITIEDVERFIAEN